MVLILLADGFEEIEALTPLDILRRGGLDVKTASISEKLTVCGAHGIRVAADMLACDVTIGDVDMLILPGGMPGAANLDEAPITDAVINSVTSRGGHIGAICAAPFILGKRGLLKSKKACCYPGFEDRLIEAYVCTEGVVTDGNVTTARGMGVAVEFALELLKISCGADIAEKIKAAIIKQ